MHINIDREDGNISTGPIILAYFEPGLIGVVFLKHEEGPSLGGRMDTDLEDLYWFEIVDGALQIPAIGPVESWFIVA